MSLDSFFLKKNYKGPHTFCDFIQGQKDQHPYLKEQFQLKICANKSLG